MIREGHNHLPAPSEVRRGSHLRGHGQSMKSLQTRKVDWEWVG